MTWQPTSYVMLGFVAAGISALVAVRTWENRDERGAGPFMLLLGVLAAWSLVYGIQLGFQTKTGQLRLQGLALAVGGAIPPIWLVFTVQYAGKDEWLTPFRQAVLTVEPIVFGSLTLTNPLHDFMWNVDETTVVETAVGSVASLALGVGYYLHIGYAYVLITIGLGLLGAVFVQSSQVYRRQAVLLILGTIPPFVGNIVYTLRIQWGPLPAVDPTPFAFVITGVLFGLALYQFDLLSRTPVARRRVLDEMGDGLIVLDTDGYVVDVNSIAHQTLDPSPEINRPITRSCPESVETVADARRELDGQTILSTVDGAERAYDLDWSELTDHRNERIGHVIALRDVTDRTTYEQRLEVAQRVLRHNLRNDMGVILSWANHISETSTNGQEQAAQRIIDTATDLVDLSEKMQTLVRMEAAVQTDPITVDVAAVVRSVVDRFTEEFSDARIEFDDSLDVAVQLPDPAFLQVPLANLVENAIEHNDDKPWVGIRIEQRDSQLRIHVEDTAPKIPEMEQEVIESGSEDPLQHGSGIGLWLAYWSITAVGGSIEFATREPRGNVVTLTIPLDSTTVSPVGLATGE